MSGNVSEGCPRKSPSQLCDDWASGQCNWQIWCLQYCRQQLVSQLCWAWDWSDTMIPTDLNSTGWNLWKIDIFPQILTDSLWAYSSVGFIRSEDITWWVAFYRTTLSPPFIFELKQNLFHCLHPFPLFSTLSPSASCSAENYDAKGWRRMCTR